MKVGDPLANGSPTSVVYASRASIHIIEVSLVTDPARPEIGEESLRHSLEAVVCEGDVHLVSSVSSVGAGIETNVRVEVAAEPDAEPGVVIEEVLRRLSCVAAMGEAIMHARVLREQAARRADPDALREICRRLEESEIPFEIRTLFDVAPDAGVWVSGINEGDIH